LVFAGLPFTDFGSRRNSNEALAQLDRRCAAGGVAWAGYTIAKGGETDPRQPGAALGEMANWIARHHRPIQLCLPCRHAFLSENMLLRAYGMEQHDLRFKLVREGLLVACRARQEGFESPSDGLMLQCGLDVRVAADFNLRF
jgi:hypothetical protein